MAKTTKTTALKNSLSDEILQIKSKQDKIGLYLSLLEQDLVSLQSVAAYSLSKEINQEVKSFLLQRLKEMTGSSTETSSFSNDEVKALKFIANKFINSTPVAAPSISVQEAEEMYEEDDLEDLEVVVPKAVTAPVKLKSKPKKTPKETSIQKHLDDHVIKTPVTIKDKYGNIISEEVSVINKVVLPPANIRRVPFPSPAQEKLHAGNSVDASQGRFQQLADGKAEQNFDKQ